MHHEHALKTRGMDSVTKVCHKGIGVLLRDCDVPRADARSIHEECRRICEGGMSLVEQQQQQQAKKDVRLSQVLRKLKLAHLERVLKANGIDSVAKVCSVGMVVLSRGCDEVEARDIHKECCSILEGSPRTDRERPRGEGCTAPRFGGESADGGARGHGGEPPPLRSAGGVEDGERCRDSIGAAVTEASAGVRKCQTDMLGACEFLGDGGDEREPSPPHRGQN
eukprot:gene12679-biopygen9474